VHAPPGLEPALVARLHAQSNAARWSVSRERFAVALSASLAHARAAGDIPDPERYLGGLHLEDLALAVACIDGHDAAWEHFMAEHKAVLVRAAMAIDPAGGSDLADSLYGDLFGLQQRAGERQSLFRYFHGRSRLATWLRAILAQRHIDRVRATKRLAPLPEDEDRTSSSRPALIAEDRSDPPEGERLRFFNAMCEALAWAIGELAAKDRLRLSSYYARDMTLAAIGRMLGEHEATVSRHLTRTRREIRVAAQTRLREHHGLDERAMAECFASVTEDAGALDLAELFSKPADRKTDRQNRSKR
jgi:RNA polymerase sigma-70 factor, ECF subfamily